MRRGRARLERAVRRRRHQAGKRRNGSQLTRFFSKHTTVKPFLVFFSRVPNTVLVDFIYNGVYDARGGAGGRGTELAVYTALYRFVLLYVPRRGRARARAHGRLHGVHCMERVF